MARGVTLSVVAVLLAACGAAAAPPADDAARRDLLPLPPGVASGALGGFVNPAAWAAGAPGDLAFWWNDRSFQERALDNWGFSNGGPVGFSVERRTFAGTGGRRLRVHEVRAGVAHRPM